MTSPFSAFDPAPLACESRPPRCSRSLVAVLAVIDSAQDLTALRDVDRVDEEWARPMLIRKLTTPLSEYIMTNAKLLAVALAMAVLGGCSGMGSSMPSSTGPATHAGQPGHYPDTGAGN